MQLYLDTPIRIALDREGMLKVLQRDDFGWSDAMLLVPIRAARQQISIAFPYRINSRRFRAQDT
jgi:hypothetical protein